MLEGYRKWDISLHTLAFLACLITKFQSQMIFYVLMLSLLQKGRLHAIHWYCHTVLKLTKFIYSTNIYLSAYCVLDIILISYNTVINKIYSTVINIPCSHRSYIV